MERLPLTVLYHGTDQPLPEQRMLQAGPLSLIFEDGSVRYIRLGEREILRRVYVAVRDHNWDIVVPLISDLRIESDDESFHITYEAEHKLREVEFRWRGTIKGDAQGTVTFTMEGKALSTFLRNRIGFCVLHPIEGCAGRPCIIESADDGAAVEGRFPQYISPHQPFTNIRAISHEVVPGISAIVQFAGDIFEMEDQRNWSDASYKTYCTPLSRPFPVEIKQGTIITQSVVLSQSGEIPIQRTKSSARSRVGFTVDKPSSITLPRVGLGVASHVQPLSEREVSRLRQLNLSHLRVELNLAGADYQQSLRRATAEAQALGIRLEIALILSDAGNEELQLLSGVLEGVKPPVGAWLVFHSGEKVTSERWIKLARRYLESYDLAAKIGGGTNRYFTELNRERPVTSLMDFVSYSINPQVHAFDNSTLVENLQSQAETVVSARQFIGDVPLAVGPVTLKARFNPNVNDPALEPTTDQLPDEVDVRQMSLFGAGWTAGSLKYLAESGVHSVTYYETSGWRGVMERETGSPRPNQFRSLPGSVFPLYHVLADFGEFAGGVVVPTKSDEPLKVDGFALYKDGKTRVVLANMTSLTQAVTIQNLGEQLRVRRLNETNAEAAILSPEDFREPSHSSDSPMQSSGSRFEIDLLPFEVLRIDFGG
ncbi:MAG: hypothetical protein H0T92_11605 [Pyrinomonadaceae bacterium]|nr:hypothetical protein [Pyrinomonadaceae bacterium]